MSQLIYIETSIPSFYYETRSRAQFQARREWTCEWWDVARLRDELVTSLAVIAELEEAPAAKRTKCIKLMTRCRCSNPRRQWMRWSRFI
jgi:hypothetical protein